MFNTHLLRLELSVKDYQALLKSLTWKAPGPFLAKLPAHVVARCPICGVENVERFNTYSARTWTVQQYGRAVYHTSAVVRHCEHFVLVQTFFNFHGQWPGEADGKFGPEVPHVIGHLLEREDCRAVLHALPVCRIENNRFAPRYTLFMLTYFAADPKPAYENALGFNHLFFELPHSEPFADPPDGREHWWDLKQWVAGGKLFWMQSTPNLPLATQAVADFPYGDVAGRRYPYFLYYPRPIPPLARANLMNGKGKIKAIVQERRRDDETNRDVPHLKVEWDGTDFTGFTMTLYPVADLFLPAAALDGSGRWVKVFARDMRGFSLRRDPGTGLTEIILETRYAPGERSLGLTDQVEAATKWVTEANQLLETLRQTWQYHFELD